MSAGAPQIRHLRCDALLQRSGWMSPAYVVLDGQGLIIDVSAAAAPAASSWEDVPGYVIPGFQNAHSHAFQYLMAGLAEHRPNNASGDDFWAWRDAMYHCALQLRPEQMQAVATMAYAEMVRHGYTAVAEFHYLHHDEHGVPYSDPAEMSRRLMAAAEAAGIHLTLLPVLYQKGGFTTAPSPKQRRFIHGSVDDYLDLLILAERAAGHAQDVQVGRGIHSLRAVAAAEILQVLGQPFNGPAHIHVAEQTGEVEQCLKATGMRPVDWLLTHLPLDQRFSLIHATHMDQLEIKNLAASNATVVVAPSTEANLGDGLFSLREYWQLGGRFAIGSDSQVTLSPIEELRWLDYGQRLRSKKRQILTAQPGDEYGTEVFTSAWTRGRLAMGQSADDFFSIGTTFDAVVLDPEHPAIYGKSANSRLSALIYAGSSDCLLGTIRRGHWLAKHGRHLGQAAIRREYQQAIDTIRSQAQS